MEENREEKYISSGRRANESLSAVCSVILYLQGRNGIPSRELKEKYRDILLSMVKYEKIPFKGPDCPGGYLFDRDSLWNDFFLAIPRYRKIIEHRKIRSLEELEYYATEWRNDNSTFTTSLDAMIENGFEPYGEKDIYGGRKKGFTDFED